LESKWRDNVAELGYTGGPYSKIARVVSGPFTDWYVTDFRGPLFIWMLEPLPPTGYPVNGFAMSPPSGEQSFPYDMDVEPD
jgi:hypothetical protein